MTTDDRTFGERVRAGNRAGSTSAQLRETQAALAASQADLTRVEAEQERAVGLLEYALHLRQHGEHAPGGNETWAEFDQRCERFLRNPSARPAPHLEAVKRERDALAVLNAELKAEAAHWRAVAERHLTQLGEVARALGTARYQNQLLSAELASARQEHLHCPIPTEEKP